MVLHTCTLVTNKAAVRRRRPDRASSLSLVCSAWLLPLYLARARRYGHRGKTCIATITLFARVRCLSPDG